MYKSLENFDLIEASYVKVWGLSKILISGVSFSLYWFFKFVILKVPTTALSFVPFLLLIQIKSGCKLALPSFVTVTEVLKKYEWDDPKYYDNIKNNIKNYDNAFFKSSKYASKILLNACDFKKNSKRFEIYHLSSNNKMTVIKFAKIMWKRLKAKGKLITKNKKVFLSTHVSDRRSVWKLKNVKKR